VPERDTAIDLFGAGGVLQPPKSDVDGVVAIDADVAVSGRTRADVAPSRDPVTAEQPAKPAIRRPRNPTQKRDRGPSEQTWQWSGLDKIASHRYPLELLDALDELTRRLNLPVGLTVSAALASLLDRSDADITTAVERAADARPRTLRRR